MQTINLSVLTKEEFIQSGMLPAIGLRVETQKSSNGYTHFLLFSAKEYAGVLSVMRFLPYTCPVSPDSSTEALLNPAVVTGATQYQCSADSSGREMLIGSIHGARFLSVPKDQVAELIGLLGEGDWIVSIKESRQNYA